MLEWQLLVMTQFCTVQHTCSLVLCSPWGQSLESWGGNPVVFHYYTPPLAPFSNFCMSKTFLYYITAPWLPLLVCCWVITHLFMHPFFLSPRQLDNKIIPLGALFQLLLLFIYAVCITLPIKGHGFNKKNSDFHHIKKENAKLLLWLSEKWNSCFPSSASNI